VQSWNNINEFWDFYHGTIVGAGSPKVYKTSSSSSNDLALYEGQVETSN